MLGKNKKHIWSNFIYSINLLRIIRIGIELNKKRCKNILVASDIHKYFFESHKFTIVFVFKMDAHIYGEKNSKDVALYIAYSL